MLVMIRNKSTSTSRSSIEELVMAINRVVGEEKLKGGIGGGDNGERKEEEEGEGQEVAELGFYDSS